MDKKEFMDVAIWNGPEVIFGMAVDWSDIVHNDCGVEYFNSLVDEFVDDGYLFENLSYVPVSFSAMGDVIVNVHADATGWLAQKEEDETPEDTL